LQSKCMSFFSCILPPCFLVCLYYCLSCCVHFCYINP
jgi:hypothetical protein